MISNRRTEMFRMRESKNSKGKTVVRQNERDRVIRVIKRNIKIGGEEI